MNTMFAFKTEDEVIAAAMGIMESKACRGDYFTGANEVKEYFRLRLGHRESEVFCVMLLNSGHQMVAVEDLFSGTIDGCSVYPREVVKLALKHNAAACIFSHNHPSGSVEPSEADKRITKRLTEALELIDVRVLDHIVVSSSQTASFAERGLI